MDFNDNIQNHGPHGGTDTVQCDLNICPSCGSSFVFPTEWSPAGTGQWSVDLRCPECEWSGGGTYPQRTLDEYDRILDEGTETLIDDLKLLSRANMEDEISNFAQALDVGLIIPEDF